MQQSISIKKLTELLEIYPVKDTQFLGRLGANFPLIFDLFNKLYHHHRNYDSGLKRLFEVLIYNFEIRNSDLKKTDLERIKKPGWFASNEITGMMFYPDLFNENFKGIEEKIPYFKDLGINLLHIMPFLDVPEKENDGGYAVQDYRKTNPKFGTIEDFERLVNQLHKNNIYITIDFVLNHCADTHLWAIKAKNGDPFYKDFFYIFKDSTIPDLYEKTMLEIFPDTAPGNFTYLEKEQEFVMTLFHNYQWDLNYKNPFVLVEMLDTLLFLANKGVDIFRLDAVAYMWKEIGKYNQNLPEVHTILQIFKLCGQIVAPGVAFLAEAIVAPDEILKYFGENNMIGNECDLAYNATFMAACWEAIATGNTDLCRKSIQNIIDKPKYTSWINYARCHDDIGFGIDDGWILELGKNPLTHRLYILHYYCDDSKTSFARGKRFMQEPNGNARLSGSLASLCGLEKAMEEKNDYEISQSINKINLLHAVILSIGGIPMIYSGDEIGTTNDYSYLKDDSKNHDNRWMHRPKMDWEIVENLAKHPIKNKIFSNLKRLIKIRKETNAFTDKKIWYY